MQLWTTERWLLFGPYSASLKFHEVDLRIRGVKEVILHQKYPRVLCEEAFSQHNTVPMSPALPS